MVKNKLKFEQILQSHKLKQNWLWAVKRFYKWRLLILAVLLFILSLGVPSVFAKVSAQTSIVQIQPRGLQLVQQAKRSYESGEFGQAAAIWQQAVSIFAAQGDILNQAMALSNLSLTYQQLAEWDKAEQASAESLNLLKKEESTPEKIRILAQSLDIQGQLQLTTGQLETALETWQQAANTYQQVGEGERMAQSLVNIAQVQQELGLYPRSCKTLLQALNLEKIVNCNALAKPDESEGKKQELLLSTLQQLPDSLIKATGLRSLGDFLRMAGNLNLSEQVLRVSLEVAQRLVYPEDISAAWVSLGNNLRVQKNKTEEALEAYQKASEQSTSSVIRFQSQLNRLSLLLEKKQYSKAQMLWSEVEEQIKYLPSNRAGIYARINLAQSLLCLKQLGLKNERPELSSPLVQQCYTSEEEVAKNAELPPAIDLSWSKINNKIDEILTVAIEQAKNLKDQRAYAYALGYRGGLYQQIGDLSLAEKFTREALSLTSSFKVPDIAYRWQWQLGRLLQAQAEEKRQSQNADPEAIAAYTSAFNTLQSLRSDLVVINPEVQFNFRDSVEPFYREFVEVLLQDEKPSQKQLEQARDAIEALQLAELDNFFREACVVVKQQKIDEFNSKSAVIYAIILKNRIEVILSLPKQELRRYSTREVQNIENILNELRKKLRIPRPSDQVKELSKQVYSWLIKPLEEDLKKHQEVRTLVFVLDGSLRNIPMAVLYDESEHKYLIEKKYALALTPGLRLLSPKNLPRQKLAVLTGGVSETRTIGDEMFPALENVEIELRQIRSVVHRGKDLLNPTFTKESFLKEIKSDTKFSIVHLATHGEFSSNPEKTFILTYDELLKRKQLNELLKTSGERKDRIIELLVLSACKTAEGDKRATLGLAGVAVRAGARSTLATLWRVSDRSTAEVMVKFYQELQDPKVTKAEALHKAQLDLFSKEKTLKRSKFQ